jgi:hypothetical protein
MKIIKIAPVRVISAILYLFILKNQDKKRMPLLSGLKKMKESTNHK